MGEWHHETRPWLLDCTSSDKGTYVSSCHSIGLYTRLLGDLALEEQCVEDQLVPPLASLGLCRPEARHSTACNTAEKSSTQGNSTSFWSQLLKMLVLWPAVAMLSTFAFGLHRRRARWWAGPHLPGYLGFGDGSVAPTVAEQVLEWFGLYSAEPDLYHRPGAPCRIPTRIPLQLVKEGFRGRSDDPHCRSASGTQQRDNEDNTGLVDTIAAKITSALQSSLVSSREASEASCSTSIFERLQATAAHAARERKKNRLSERTSSRLPFPSFRFRSQRFRSREDVTAITPHGSSSDISLLPAPSPPPSPSQLPDTSSKNAVSVLDATLNSLRPWVTVFYPCGRFCHVSPIIEGASLLGALISSILIILFKFEAVVSADDYTNNTAILRPSNHLPLAGWLIERLFRDEAGVLHTDGNFFESESQATLMQFHAIVPPMLAVAYVVFLWTLIAAGSNIGRTEQTASRSFLVRQLISFLVTVVYLALLVYRASVVYGRSASGPLYSAMEDTAPKKPLRVLVTSLYIAHGAALCACLVDYSRLLLLGMLRQGRITRECTVQHPGGGERIISASLRRVRMEVGLPIELIAASLASFLINLSIVIALCFWLKQLSEDLAQVCTELVGDLDESCLDSPSLALRVDR